MRVHANDGLSATAKERLTQAGFQVSTDHVPQDLLAQRLKQERVDVLLVRSATQARKELIDACPDLKLIGRGGVGMDNIDVAYAKERGLSVINTPASSSISVAELVMAHLFGMMRGLPQANRRMPVEGLDKFKDLKKEYEKGGEVRGRTLGVIGFGRIGQWTAKYALGCGMRVIYVDHHCSVTSVTLQLGDHLVEVPVDKVDIDELLLRSDAISLHVPAQKDGRPVLGAEELARVKPGAVIVNTARGGSIDEDALLHALNDGRVKAAALDVFVGEPQPRADLLAHPKLSLSPHIGAATAEAQSRIGDELADLIIAFRAKVTADQE
ncbi:MAG: D-2-hydroxyacid dehydrogenase [Flavobacteriales bacterium]|nr:D-2-hydroxyacid dehydrogenase [Flavobacteriales bacterium]MBP6697679.1 D-2-hydroxyacid dehydrogenase [Flavobacteriales bacterium]